KEAGAMKRCLIVDDSSVIRKIARRILAGPTMLVAEAESAAEAIDICTHEMPETGAVDYRLPDMDSTALTGRPAKLDPQRKPDIIFCVCEFEVSLLTRAKRAGASGYLMKPFTRLQLLESFRELDARAAA